MPKRCTLISPTNLMLEQPMLSPVDESEFLLFGKKEFERITRGIRAESWSLGVMAGFALAAVVVFVASTWMHR